jgi:L-threonylcarbamoyladenylate synthase
VRLVADLLPAADPANIVAVSRLLRDGGVAVIPTDTVYGLAASVYREPAVDRIYAIKQRPRERQVPILLATAADLPLLVEEIPRGAWTLITHFWPGPLTLILPARPTVPRWIRGDSSTVGVRVPAGRSCLQLLQSVGEPLVGTSANVGGGPPALTAQEAMESLGSEIDAVLVDDAGLTAGSPSTVVEVSESGAVVHREGEVSASRIRQALGLRVEFVH